MVGVSMVATATAVVANEKELDLEYEISVALRDLSLFFPSLSAAAETGV